jgi:hypothetical protein
MSISWDDHRFFLAISRAGTPTDAATNALGQSAHRFAPLGSDRESLALGCFIGPGRAMS